MSSATAKPSESAFAFAGALLELAESRGVLPAVTDDVAAIGKLIHDTPRFAMFLKSPAIKHADRLDLFQKTILPSANKLTGAFIELLLAKGKTGLLGEICRAFAILLDARRGRVEVSVTVARALGGPEFENVRNQIAAAIGKEVVATQQVDESIIGGIVVRIGDKLIDGSVKAQLESMKRRMLVAK